MIDFSRLPPDSIAGAILRWPLRLLPGGLTVPILQGKCRGLRWTLGAGNHGCWLGSYEATKQTLFSHHVQPGDVVYDIGANVGFYTLLSSQLVGPSGRVIAFEPSPRALSYLRRHVRINHLANVTIKACAVSSKSGSAFMSEAQGHSLDRLSDHGTPVEVVRLDEFIKDSQLPAPSVLKIDIEGSEFDALCGAERTLREFKPTIFLATHSHEIRLACTELLESHSYSIDVIARDELLAHQGSGP